MMKQSSFTDEQLVDLILSDDKEAQGELYNRYYKKVFYKCFSFVKNNDEAFDLAEESLIRTFDKLKTFRGDSLFRTWLFTITHRTCLEYLRKKNRENNQSDEILLEKVETADEDGMDLQEIHEQESIMFALIENLPEQERQLLLKKYYEGESIESLQSMLNISASAVKMRLKRSKDKLNYLYTIALTYGLAAALSLL